jgi:glycosyltransferase involved in cell wall biosynthesis
MAQVTEESPTMRDPLSAPQRDAASAFGTVNPIGGELASLDRPRTAAADPKPMTASATTAGAALPLVSIISSYYNRASYVDASVKSLLAQHYPNIEIILVDDGSTDDTYQRMRAFDDPRLTAITHANCGLVRSFRKAISMSRGEIIAIHGSGDISFPDRIEKQVRLLLERPDVGVVGSFYQRISYKDGSIMTIKPKISGDPSVVLIDRNFLAHGAVAFRRRVYDQVGGYRQTFVYAEDRDLWLRLSQVTDFHIIEEVLYRCDDPPDSISRTPRKRMMETYLSEFAVSCHVRKMMQGRDWLEEFGDLGILFRPRSRRLSKQLYAWSKYHLLAGDLTRAAFLNELSRQEGWTLRNSVNALTIALQRHNPRLGSAIVWALAGLQKLKSGPVEK